MTLMPNTVVATGAASDVQVVPGMVVFGGAGGRSNEGRLQLDGISVGSAFNGGGVSAYIADVGNAQEVAMTTSGGLGEAEVGGPSLNVVPKTGGNTVKGSVYLSGVTKGMIGSNYTDDLKARGLLDAGLQHENLGLQRRRRRTDQEGSVVVLLHLARRGQPSDGARHVREPERGRSDQVDVRARCEQARRGGRVVPHDLAAADVAGDAAQQDQRVLGRADAVRRRGVAGRDRLRLPQVRRQRDHRRRHRGADAGGERDVRAGNRGVPRLRDAFPSGLVAVAGDEPTAPRSGRRQLREPVSREADAGHARARLHPGHRTVRGRLRGKRRHPEPDVPGRNTRARAGSRRTTGARRCRMSRASSR